MLFRSEYATYYAYADFGIYYKTAADAEWTRTGKDDDGLNAIPAWGQDSDMWVQLIEDSPGAGYCLQQRDGSGWMRPSLIVMGDSSVSVEYEIEEWDAGHVIFHVKPKDYGADKQIGVSIPQSNCSRVIMDETRSEERRVGKECRSRWSPYH